MELKLAQFVKLPGMFGFVLYWKTTQSRDFIQET